MGFPTHMMLVPEDGVSNVAKQAYRNGSAFQWVRESVVNSIQAGATWVNLGIERQGFEKHGVARRYVADNGHGMSKEDMVKYLTSFSGGGRTISETDNFGQGFKASCLDWNRYGIIVASWTKGDPEGSLVWMKEFEYQGEKRWGLKEFEYYDESGEYQDPSVIVPGYDDELDIDLSLLKSPEIEEAGQGTVFLFLGDSKNRDTDRGDFTRDSEQSSRSGIVKYLNSRFIEIPENVTVKCQTFETKKNAADTERRDTKDVVFEHVKSNGKLDRKTPHSRTVEGIISRIGYSKRGEASNNVQHGSVTSLHNTRIDWYLTERDDIMADASYQMKSPAVLLRYEDEVYEMPTSAAAIRAKFRDFGITDEIQSRVWLIVTPPAKKSDDDGEWGVVPQASRSRLVGPGGNIEMPWHEWSDHFANNLPDPIRKARTEAQNNTTAESTAEERREHMKRLLENFGTRWKSLGLVPNEEGEESGRLAAGEYGQPRVGNAVRGPKEVSSHSAPKTGAHGEERELVADPKGTHVGKTKRISNGIPEVVWDASFPDDEAKHAARWDKNDNREGSFGTIHLNFSHPLFSQQVEYWSDRYYQSDSARVVAVLKSVYEEEAVSKILHANALAGRVVGEDEDGEKVKIKTIDIEKMTGPEALTTGLLGVLNVEQRMQSKAALLGKIRKGNNASAKKKSRKGHNEALDELP